MVFGFACGSVWVASTCSTSDVPMPKASAPNAPWVAVWLSPQTMVRPGCVSPCSGPMTWTMPWRTSFTPNSGTPNSSQFCAQHLDLLDGERVGPGLVAVDGGDVVVDGREREVGAADLAACKPEAFERLRGGHLVDEVEVDVEQVGLAGFAADNVVIPDFLGGGTWLGHVEDSRE